MKIKFLSIFIIAICSLFHSCKSVETPKYDGILQTKNISLIEKFLKNSDENDPRRFVLKQRLIALRNAEMKNNTETAREMIAKPIFREFSANAAEAEEFKKLISKNTSADHQKKTVKLLNTLFDQDISSKDVILLVQNKSDCNMILRLEGKAFFNLAIPTHGENSLVLPKGNYILSSNVCDVRYNSTKNILKNIMITLDNPVVNIIRN